ncbi:MAG: CvpA family protein [Schleiferiaceae bacterium]|nr:CvpA family protein [Schleiferiaceae bacterium]
MILLDIALLLPIGIGLVRGLQKGLLYTVGSLGGYVTGFLVAIYFYESLTVLIDNKIGWGTGFEIKAAAFLVLLLIPVFLMRIVAKSMTGALNWLSLGPLNYILGAFVGMLKYAIIEMGIIYASLYVKAKVQLPLPDFYENSQVYAFYVDLLRNWFDISL